MLRGFVHGKFKPSLSYRWIGWAKCEQYRLLLEQLEDRCVPAAVSWDGGAGTSNWQDANNWDTDVAPTSADDAVIPVAFSASIINVNGGVARTLDSYAKITQSAGTFSLGAAASDVSMLRNGFSMTNGTFTANGEVDVFGSSSWTGGTIAGGGNVTNESGAALSAGSSSPLTLSTTLNNLGAITQQGSNLISSGTGGTLNNSGTYKLAMTISGTAIGSGITFNNTGTLDQTAGKSTSISGTFNNQGGALQAEAGALSMLAGGTNTGATMIVASGATISLSNTATYSGTYSGSGAGSVTLFGNLKVDPDGASFNFASGLFTWTSATLQTGNLTVNGFMSAGNAVLVLGSGTSITDSGTITNLGGAGITISDNALMTIASSGSASGAGTANVLDQGHLAVDGSLSLTGSNAVSVADGGLLTGSGTITGNVLNRGNVNPGGVGSAGILTVTGNYTQDTQSPITFELGGTTAGSGYDQLAVSGNVTLNQLVSIVNARLINSFTPTIGDSFQPLTYGGTLAQTFAVYSLESGSGVYLASVLGSGSLTLNANATTTNTLIGTTPLGVSPNDIWHNPANWSRGVAPTISDDVVIPSMGGTTITYKSNAAIDNVVFHSINASEPVSIDSQGNRLNFTLSTISNFSFGLSLAGNNGTLAATQSITLAGGNWTNQSMIGSFTNIGTLTFAGGGTRAMIGATLVSAGTINFTGNNTLQLHSSKFANQGLGNINIQSGASLQVQNTSGVNAINNAGTITDSSATTASIGVAFNNDGAVNVDSGTLSLTAGGTHTGTFGGTAGGLQFAGGTHSLTSSSSVATPNVSVTSGAVQVDGEYSPATSTTISGGTTTFNADATLTNVGNTLTVSNGTLTLNSGEAITPNSFAFQNGTIDGSDNITLANGGALNWSGGTFSGSRTVTVPAGATVTLSTTTTKTINGITFVLGGAATMTGTGALTIQNSGALTILSTGIFDIQADANFNVGAGANVVNNAGTLKKTGGAGASILAVPLVNTGTSRQTAAR